MRRSGVTALCLVFFGQAVAGCASMSEEQKGATIGAGAGAILGGVAGALLDKKNPGRGAAIGVAAGAALGGAAGWGVGAYRAKQVKTREQAAADLKYRPQQGVVTRLDGTSVIPQQVRPGDQLMLQARYVVLTPSQDGQVRVKETRTILFNNQPLKQVERETMLTLGGHDLQQLITLPRTAAEGSYTVVTTVQPISVADGRKDEGQATFMIGAGTATSPQLLPLTEVSAVPAAVQAKLDFLYVKIPLANVRDGMGAGFKVLARVPRGTPLAVLQAGGTEQDRWFKVRLANGEEGWVAASALERIP